MTDEETAARTAVAPTEEGTAPKRKARPAGREATPIRPGMGRHSRDVEHRHQTEETDQRGPKEGRGHPVFCARDSGDTLEVGSGFDIMGRSAGYGRQVIRRRIIKGRRHRAAQGSRTARGRSPFYAILKTKGVTAGRPSVGVISPAERWLFAGQAAGNGILRGWRGSSAAGRPRQKWGRRCGSRRSVQGAEGVGRAASKEASRPSWVGSSRLPVRSSFCSAADSPHFCACATNSASGVACLGLGGPFSCFSGGSSGSFLQQNYLFCCSTRRGHAGRSHSPRHSHSRSDAIRCARRVE